MAEAKVLSGADEKPQSPSLEEAIDATRRTLLASERTELAWWRTGLASPLAVALAVGRVVPGLDRTPQRGPYVVIGVCFAIYGVAVIAWADLRRRSVEIALEEGRFPTSPRIAHGALVAGGIILGLLTVVLILLD